MKLKYLFTTSMALLIGFSLYGAQLHELTESEWDSLLTINFRKSENIDEGFLSYTEMMLNTVYFNGPLGEGADGLYDKDPMYDFSRVDCVTFLEQALAAALSTNWNEFIINLKKIRYKNGNVSFRNRNHFFCSDWIKNNIKIIEDITENIGGEAVVTETRDLFVKNFYSKYGIDTTDRKYTETYIPLNALKKKKLREKLKPGFLISIIGDKDILFSIHTGLIASTKEGEPVFRHASNKEKKVTDIILKTYLRKYRGIEGIKVMRIRTQPAAVSEKAKGVDLLLEYLREPEDFAGDKITLSEKEIQTFLDDPRFGSKIYYDKLVRILEPSFPVEHERSHVNYFARLKRKKYIQQGAKFIWNHKKVLEKAQKEFGVSYYDIVSILQAESNLGRITGRYQCVNVFYTQIFHADSAIKDAEKNFISKYKDKYSRDELEKMIVDNRPRLKRVRNRAAGNLASLIKIHKLKNSDPFIARGSWAGAIGYPQFMPRSMTYARDGDGNGEVNLHDFDDAIFSIASYLKAHRYHRDRKKSIWHYNHDKEYVNGILGYANALRRWFGVPEKN
ncbi:MAG: N-acetylmuramoyl-L-alanine amidase-like domain-containing protein [Fibrobacterota bacterium]